MFEEEIKDTSITIDLSGTGKHTVKHSRGDCDRLLEADGRNLATIETCLVEVERGSVLRNLHKRESGHVVKCQLHAQSPGLPVVLSRCVALMVILSKISKNFFGFSCDVEYCQTIIGFQREIKKDEVERTSSDCVHFGAVLFCLVWKYLNNMLRPLQCFVSNLACMSSDILCNALNDDTTCRRLSAGQEVEKRLTRTEFNKAKKCSCIHTDGGACEKSRCFSNRKQPGRTGIVYDTRPAGKKAKERFESLVRSRNSLEVKTTRKFITRATNHMIHHHDCTTDVNNNSNEYELSSMEVPMAQDNFNNPNIQNDSVTYDLIGSPITLSASKREFDLGERSRNISWTATTEVDVTKAAYSSDSELSLPSGMCLRSGSCYSPKGESPRSGGDHSSDRLANKWLLRVMTNAGLSHQQLDTLLASDTSIESFLLTIQQVTPRTISEHSEEDLSLLSILKCLDSSPPPCPAELAGADGVFASRYFTRSLANQTRYQSQNLRGSVRSTDLECYSHNDALNQDIKDDSISSAQLLSPVDPIRNGAVSLPVDFELFQGCEISSVLNNEITFWENLTPRKNTSMTLPYNPSALNNRNKTLPSCVAHTLTECIATVASPSDAYQRGSITNLLNLSEQDYTKHPDQEAGETWTSQGSHPCDDWCGGRDSFTEEFPNLWEALDYITQSGELDDLASSDRMIGGEVGSLSFVSGSDPVPLEHWGTWGLQAMSTEESCDHSRTPLSQYNDLSQCGSDYSGLSFPEKIGGNSPFEPLEQKHGSISSSSRGIKRSVPGDDNATVKKSRLSNDNIFMPTEPAETPYSRNLARLVSVLAGNRTGSSAPTLSATRNSALLAKVSQISAGNSESSTKVLQSSINSGRRAKLLPNSRNLERFTKVLPGSRNSGRPTNVSPGSRKSGRYTKMLPISRSSGRFTKVLPDSRKCARLAKVLPASRKSARLAKLLPASRKSARLAMVSAASRKSARLAKVIPDSRKSACLAEVSPASRNSGSSVIATNTNRNSASVDRTSASVGTSGRVTRESLSVIKSGRVTKVIHATRASARLGKLPHGDIKPAHLAKMGAAVKRSSALSTNNRKSGVLITAHQIARRSASLTNLPTTDSTSPRLATLSATVKRSSRLATLLPTAKSSEGLTNVLPTHKSSRHLATLSSPVRSSPRSAIFSATVETAPRLASLSPTNDNCPRLAALSPTVRRSTRLATLLKTDATFATLSANSGSSLPLA